MIDKGKRETTAVKRRKQRRMKERKEEKNRGCDENGLAKIEINTKKEQYK
jgi:hypothetical protein